MQFPPVFSRSVALVILTGGLVFVPKAPAVPPGYQLLWADEFNGNALNTTNWDYLRGARREAINTHAAVSVTNGLLTITTYTVNGTNFTGFIGSRDIFQMRYGYVEASISFNDTNGGWSAFWMQSPTISTVGDPHNNGTEMDIVEHRYVDASNTNIIADQASSAIHWDGYAPGTSKSVGSGPRASGLSTGFHTYSVEWTPD